MTGEDANEKSLTERIISEGIEWAESRIDSRLARRYNVPFNPVPKVVGGLASDLAAYFVLREAYAGGGENNAPTLAREIYEEAEKLLADLVNGDAMIPGVLDKTNPMSPLISRDKTPGIMASFDLVNRPKGNRPPFAPYQRHL